MDAGVKIDQRGFDVLRTTLESAPRDREFLMEYVREMELRRHEEDTFLRLAFRHVSPGGALGRGETFIVSVVSEMYEPLGPQQKLELRKLWHQMVRREAERFGDLEARLSKLS